MIDFIVILRIHKQRGKNESLEKETNDMGQIGFTMEACSSGGFNFSRSRWTEGDLWLAKQALAKSKNKIAGWSANEALIEAIEGQFTKMKELKFDAAVSDTPEFELCVFQDFNFKYKFDPKRSSSIMRFELAQKIASCKNEMGDQVALALFECIEEYKVHYLSKGLSRENYNFLNVWIYL